MSSLLQHYNDDEIVINYNDAIIYGRDLKLLENSTEWLNDSCINYQLTRLSYYARTKQQQQSSEVDNNEATATATAATTTTTDTATDAILLDPSVLSFLMHQCDNEDEMRDMANGHNNFNSIKYFFLPINDMMGTSGGAWQIPGKGTHWSLLVAVVVARCASSSESTLKFFHLDSVKGSSNSRAALVVAKKWYETWSLVQVTNQQQAANDIIVEECEVPQQRNGYDCGLHVLAMTEALLLMLSSSSSSSSSSSPRGPTKEALEACIMTYFNIKNHHEKNNNSDGSAVVELCKSLRKRIANDIRSLAAA